MKRLLFITWDGPQVSYLEGLFFPILEGLTPEYVIDVVQFTWGSRDKSDRLEALLAAAGMRYTRVDIKPRSIAPLGTLLTLLRGAFGLRSFIRSADVVLFRSNNPGLMVLPWMNRRRKWVFDADGLPLDERVDFGRLRRGSLYFRSMKWVESVAVKKADRVMVRSMMALPALTHEAPPDKFHVVLNGRDPTRYRLPEAGERAALRRELGVTEDELLLVYCGSLGAQYCLPEMIRLLEAVRKRRPAKLMILTGSPGYLEPGHGLLVFSLPPGEVPRYLGASDAGLAIRQQTPSMKAVSPVKLGEYLLCGLPVVASAGIGDSEGLLAGEPACLLLGDHSPASLESAARWVEQAAGDKAVQNGARRLGLEKFGLEAGILSYKKALEEL